MAIHINLTTVLSKNKDEKDAKIHLMPCLIKTDGEANVSRYFEPNVSSDNEEVLSSSFRGHPLLGKEVEVPTNYYGIVLSETHEKFSEETDRSLYATEKFSKLTYWNWDKAPSKQDKLIATLDWIDISKAIHSPVDL